MDISTIRSGKTADGAKYLELFLQQYTALFKETVNPGCGICLQKYLSKYKNAVMAKTQNTSGYVLKNKYENIPLKFGSRILVNNSNIDKYGAELLKREGGEKFFDKIPTPAPAQKSKLTVKQAKSLINKATTLHELEAFTNDDRKGIIKAVKAKKAHLAQQQK